MMTTDLPKIDLRNVSLAFRRADRFGTRLRGLMGPRPFASCDALHIPGCRAIHTVGMRVAIDVIFVSAAGHIVRVVQALPPWRFRYCKQACDVWELPASAGLLAVPKIGDLWPC